MEHDGGWIINEWGQRRRHQNENKRSSTSLDKYYFHDMLKRDYVIFYLKSTLHKANDDFVDTFSRNNKLNKRFEVKLIWSWDQSPLNFVHEEDFKVKVI